MLTGTLTLLAVVSAAALIELRRLRRVVERLARTRVGIVSLSDVTSFEDMIAKAWEEFLAVEAVRPNEERLAPSEKATLAVERYRAKSKHDLLLAQLNRARQAEADFWSGRKTLDEISMAFQPSLVDFVTPQREERRVYEEALQNATRSGHTA